jgi:glutamate carboxypeptidase
MLGRMNDVLRRGLAGREAPMLALLERLVNVNSFTDHREGGARVGDMLAAELAGVPGMTVRRVDSTRFAPHLIATTSAAEASAEGCVAIIGHLDTVFPPGTF